MADAKLYTNSPEVYDINQNGKIRGENEYRLAVLLQVYSKLAHCHTGFRKWG